MLQLIQITAAYSNAVLVAVLPHVSDCAKQLKLPIPQPVVASQISRFVVSPVQGETGGGLWLTNNYWFRFQNGYVGGFRSPDDWFTMADEYWDHLERYVGKDNMTTNEAIELARVSFRNLGYPPDAFQVDGPPTEFQGPRDNQKLGHIPYCRIQWESPEPKSQAELEASHHIWFDIDMQRQQVVGMSLIGKKFWRQDPQIDVALETEMEYRKRVSLKMFAHTNALGWDHTSNPPAKQLQPSLEARTNPPPN